MKYGHTIEFTQHFIVINFSIKIKNLRAKWLSWYLCKKCATN